MAHLTTSPEKFAGEVNTRLPGAYRQITVDDVRDMTTCGLIGKYGYYGNLDFEMARCIFLFERLRQAREKKNEIRDDDGVIHCRRCGVVLAKPDGKRGRPHEYCPVCEPLRARGRYQKWRRKMKAARN